MTICRTFLSYTLWEPRKGTPDDNKKFIGSGRNLFIGMSIQNVARLGKSVINYTN